MATVNSTSDYLLTCCHYCGEYDQRRYVVVIENHFACRVCLRKPEVYNWYDLDDLLEEFAHELKGASCADKSNEGVSFDHTGLHRSGPSGSTHSIPDDTQEASS